MLDSMLTHVGNEIAKGNLDMMGVPIVIESEDHIQSLRHHILTKYLPQVKIFEFYQVDVENYFSLFVDAVRSRGPPSANTEVFVMDLNFDCNTDYKRKGVTINIEQALKIFNVFRQDSFDEDTRIKKCSESFRNVLEQYNNKMRTEIDNHLTYAIDNALAGVRYERVQSDGPKYRTIALKYPVFVPYFTHTGAENKSLEDIEKMMYNDGGKFFMAHNGWVMGHDSLKDFARPQPGTANVYLRRELIAWGDSVKLRFGDKPEDSLYLWKRMKEYVDTTARLFDGVRLDNCHSTPLHVAEYIIDSARKVNPELYVVAELFTNSPDSDNIFVNRLGITSLIREALSAWDAHEEGRLVYLYGGDPVGAFFNSPKRPLAPSIAHAVFLDQSHDNPSPVEKRSVFDLLPSSALVSMACCATGSNRGYDELVPHHIHVVDEERQYQEWGKNVDESTGIISAKRALNDLHGFLGVNGFNQVYVDQMNPDIVAVTRHHPVTHESYILVAHTCFSYPNPNAGPTNVRPLTVEGKFVEIVFEAEINSKGSEPFARPSQYVKDPTFINGLTEYEVKTRKNIQLIDSRIFKTTPTKAGNATQLDFVNLRPGSVVVIRVAPMDNITKQLEKLHVLVDNFHNECGPNYQEVKRIISQLNLIDLNMALYSCDQEERDRGFGIGAYDIPGFQSLVYAGFQGFLSFLSEITPKNDLGHPVCDNLRQGDWMIGKFKHIKITPQQMLINSYLIVNVTDYISKRLQQCENTKEFSKWLELNMASLKEIPRFLIPAYFDVIVTGVYELLIAQALSLMPSFISKGSTFPQLLALSSLQFLAPIKSSNLPALSPSTAAPKPPALCTTLAAGLPHFASGYMRCWGRDTFISLRGLLLLTGRFDEARYIILGFASTLRHGLIPNLLDGGKNARFNCRDAVWWWLYCIEQYVTQVPNGKKILQEKVSRIYPKDDSEAQAPGACVSNEYFSYSKCKLKF